MSGASPAATAASLFARKGEAAPLGGGKPATRTDGPGPGIPQTDLFGYIVDPDGPDAAPYPGADGGPPPAASLLSILAQASAAVVREPVTRSVPDASADAPPAATEEIATGTAAEECPQDNVTAPATGSVLRKEPGAEPTPAADPLQPVPSDERPAPPPAPRPGAPPMAAISNLPALIPPPPAAGKSRHVAYAALAAGVFAVAAGLAAVYFGGASDRRGPGNILADRPAPVALAEPSPDAEGTPTIAAETTAATAAAAAPKIEIGDVRIDSAGRAAVSGTAAPGETLIVLRNAQPLGTVQADAAGGWTYLAAAPMRAGQHEISVVPLQADTSVVVERPDAAPLPGRRPAGSARYFVQLASLPSAADARRESAKLTQRLSGLVSPDRLGIRDATILDGRTVFRVAVSGFSDRQSADALCDRIRLRKESCLVMRGR